jgi:hypothetical protein
MATGTNMPPALPASDARFLSEMAQQLRVDSIRCSAAARSASPPPALLPPLAKCSKTEGMEAQDGY